MSSKVIDPVCGMQVDPANSAGSFEYKGATYHFCSIRCLEKFRNDPDSFLTRAAPQPAAAKGTSPLPVAEGTPLYTCPMHPEIRQDRPGSCPKCGMTLEPVAPIQPVSKTEYVCPMHPQIIRPAPGNCPICGMTLEPRVISAGKEESPELADMTRRFWISVALTLPLIFIEMADMIPRQPAQRMKSASLRTWIELALATPVVLRDGLPLFSTQYSAYC